ncbi:MAG: hypothetical protein ABEJ28_03065 [Salinigranum sp.]
MSREESRASGTSLDGRRRAFVGFLERRCGPSLRAVVRYGPGGTRPLVYRDADAVRTATDVAAEHRREPRAAADERRRCSLHLYDSLIVLHFGAGERGGFLVALSPDAGRNLVGFVENCERRLSRSD